MDLPNNSWCELRKNVVSEWRIEMNYSCRFHKIFLIEKGFRCKVCSFLYTHKNVFPFSYYALYSVISLRIYCMVWFRLWSMERLKNLWRYFFLTNGRRKRGKIKMGATMNKYILLSTLKFTVRSYTASASVPTE